MLRLGPVSAWGTGCGDKHKLIFCTYLFLRLAVLNINRFCGRGLQDTDPVVLRCWWVWKPDRSHCPCAWIVYVVWIAVALHLFSYLIFIPYCLADCHSVVSAFYGLIPLIIYTFVIKIARWPTVCVSLLLILYGLLCQQLSDCVFSLTCCVYDVTSLFHQYSVVSLIWPMSSTLCVTKQYTFRSR
jgi:hypothetical protein